MTLHDLADRVEGASGPDRELDCLIWCAMNGYEPTWSGENGQVLYAGVEGAIGWIDPGKHQRNFTTNRSTTGPASIPAYTASLDAALSLVPEGHDLTIDRRQGYSEAAVYRDWNYVASGQAKAATPALALTAACLRSHASLGKE